MLKKAKVTELYPIAPDALGFLDRSCAIYGKYKADEFSQFLWQECRQLSSPIEQLFLIALATTAEINLTQCNIGAVSPRSNAEDAFMVKPQCQIHKYRIDFALAYHLDRPIVCVELDGHQFHDRDERQRRYEKQRDRYLATHGYVVMHFTGSEVVKDPYAPALEAFNAATGLEHVAISPLDE